MRQQNYQPDPDRGYLISQPNRPAGPNTGANGKLINRDVPKASADRDLYLYVTGVRTGWQLAGQKTQARTSASFYPTNLQQNELVVRGQCANQHEYDKLVAFILNHQHTALDPAGDRLHRVDFKLTSSMKQGRRPVFPPMYVGGQIQGIRAGHERFKHHPVFEFMLKVTKDVLDQQDIETRYAVDIEKNYLATFGGENGERFYDSTTEVEYTTRDEAQEESVVFLDEENSTSITPPSPFPTPENNYNVPYWEDPFNASNDDNIIEHVDPNV